METTSLYLDLIDQIDNCLTAYKNRYLELHEAKIAKIEKKQEKIKRKQEKLLNPDEEPKERKDEKDEEEKKNQ